MSTDIVLLAQHAEAMRECIFNLRLSTEEPYRLIVVAEEDASEILEWLAQTKDVKVVVGKKGIGVAEGYNLGVRNASSSNVVLMRDYMYVTDGWLGRLAGCMERHERAVMVGPVSSGLSGLQNTPMQSDNPAVLQHFSNSIAAMRGSRSVRVPRLLSHLAMVRKEPFERLGGFDERFRQESYEDDDFCYRALQAGMELYIAQDCYIRYERKFGSFSDEPGWYARQIEVNRSRSFGKWGFDVTAALYASKRPVTISLCMIVKNEEQTLERCLSSIGDIADEIVIVDTGSTDRTKEIAARFTDRIYDFKWVDDFAAARNFAFRQADKEYILWLDADDILLPGDAAKFRELKQALPWETDAVSMVYNLSFDAHGNVTSSLRRNRLAKREKGFRWIGAVHEYLEVYGKIEYADICITHSRQHTQSSRNLHIYENRERSGAEFSTRDLYYYANELFDHSLWERSLAQYERFLQRKDIWVEDAINACGQAGDCLHKLGKPLEAKAMVLKSFAYALPRAENCCRLGYFHVEEGDYAGAAYWYKTAASLEKPGNPQALMRHACWTWLPHIQLCVCYDKLGFHDLAERHNEIAATFLPDDSRIVSNRAYFHKRKADAANIGATG